MFGKYMFGKYNGFVSKARVSTCMYFLVLNETILYLFFSKLNLFILLESMISGEWPYIKHIKQRKAYSIGNLRYLTKVYDAIVACAGSVRFRLTVNLRRIIRKITARNLRWNRKIYAIYRGYVRLFLSSTVYIYIACD